MVSSSSSSFATGNSSNSNITNNTNSTNTNSDKHHHQSKEEQSLHKEEIFDSRSLRDMACGRCIFCRMPCCERCYVCVSNDARHRGCCLRKTCISIPIEFKLRTVPSALGFPEPGWRFAFDDPQKTSLVVSTKRVPAGLAGLRMVSPRGRVFHSLESAFAHIPWTTTTTTTTTRDDNDDDDDVTAVTDALEGFLVQVGSTRYVSVPHFLVGKNYCIEFTSSNGSNIVLFGKIIARMGPPTTDGRHHGGRSDDGTTDAFFVVRYNADVLSIARRGMGTEIPPFQLLSPELAWGGCVSYERKTCCRRDGQSAIQHIDRATAVETWIAPDMRLEEVEERRRRGSDGGGGTDGGRDDDDDDEGAMPRLTVFARGYEFVFRAKIIPDDCGGEKQQFGVFVTCNPLRGENDANQEINLKPGELIDLGTFGDDDDDDDDRGNKTLSAFIVKNYIHKFKIGRWGVVSGRDDAVCDPTDDETGKLRDGPSRRVLSYVRKHAGRGERRLFPTINARIAPDMSVHMLFGMRYEGNWDEYEAGMQELVPLFGGREVEVTASRSYGFGSKQVAGSKCLQSIGVFQTEDIVASVRQLDRMFGSSDAVDRHPSSLIERSKRVVECLLDRAEKLLEMFSDVKFRSGDDCGIGFDGHDDSPLISASQHLKKLARMFGEHNMK